MFFDPAGQYRFKLPLIWAYDPLHSDLRAVTFTQWENPNEILNVGAMPTLVPDEASLESWYEALEDYHVLEDFRLSAHAGQFTQMRCGKMPAALAQIQETDPEVTHRKILVVRGRRLDIFAHHHASGSPIERRLSNTLSEICQSLEVPTNEYDPKAARQDECENYIRQANKALDTGALKEIVDVATQLERAARDTYLHSMVVYKPIPEIPAISHLVTALVINAQATKSLLPLRDAEHLAIRGLNSLYRHRSFIRAHSAQHEEGMLTTALDAIKSLHLGIDGQEMLNARPSFGFGLAMLRIDSLAKEARGSATAGHLVLAHRQCEGVVADMLTALSKLESAKQLTPEAVQDLLAVRVDSLETKASVIKRIQQSLFKGLTALLPLLSELRSSSGDTVGAVEASRLSVTAARRLNSVDKSIRE
jgi:hypothetical protein